MGIQGNIGRSGLPEEPVSASSSLLPSGIRSLTVHTMRGITKISTIMEIIVKPWSATAAHTFRVFSTR